jgi:hypothetical protein
LTHRRKMSRARIRVNPYLLKSESRMILGQTVAASTALTGPKLRR